METNYRVAYDIWWKDLKTKDPEEITTYLEVTYCSSTGQFMLTFFNSEYILDCNNETIYRKSDGYVPDMTISVLMLNYLVYARPPEETTNEWVSLKEIPGGGKLFYPAFYKTAIIGLINAFGHDSKELFRCGASFGGEPTSYGNASVIFQAFPEISLCVVIWEGDEEIAPNATILYKPSIKNLLHIESIIGLGGILASKLKHQVTIQ